MVKRCRIGKSGVRIVSKDNKILSSVLCQVQCSSTIVIPKDGYDVITTMPIYIFYCQSRK